MERVPSGEKGEKKASRKERQAMNKALGKENACVGTVQGQAKLEEENAAATIIHAAVRMYLLMFKSIISKVLLLQRW